MIDLYVNDVGPQNGARVVARAWADPTYRERLLADGSTAIHEMGYGGEEGHTMMVVANTPDVHNVIVCTLCSCYPWPVLGLPPTWYKSAPYRARVVAEPRAVLAEFGLDAAGQHRDPRLGLHRRGALPRAADAAGRHRRDVGGGARRARHARLHDRDRPADGAGAGVMATDPLLATLDLPRSNGELVFEEPWQARALGMGVVTLRVARRRRRRVARRAGAPRSTSTAMTRPRIRRRRTTRPGSRRSSACSRRTASPPDGRREPVVLPTQ